MWYKVQITDSTGLETIDTPDIDADCAAAAAALGQLWIADFASSTDLVGAVQGPCERCTGKQEWLSDVMIDGEGPIWICWECYRELDLTDADVQNP